MEKSEIFQNVAEKAKELIDSLLDEITSHNDIQDLYSSKFNDSQEENEGLKNEIKKLKSLANDQVKIIQELREENEVLNATMVEIGNL